MTQNSPTGFSPHGILESAPIRHRVPQADRNLGVLLLTVNINRDNFPFATT